ncbi:hypothetical protein ACFV1F_02830 [Streptomyces sp. NPDC059590]|uniref:hypothetical protein n=1 Tax=Streptomyces sp. NPDC059590 TaxID=3346877 RepID=UPI0036973ED7
MTKPWRRTLPLLLLPLAVTLSACGEGSVDRSELESRARALGTEPEMVYVTDVPGYTLASQSVGVIGDHGFGGAYTKPGGGTIELRVDEAGNAPVDCAKSGPDQAGGEKRTCERDGESWYRASKSAHEYAREDGGRVIRLSADRESVTRDTLRRAAKSVHQADDGELAEVLPEDAGDGGGQGGTERGDLPKTGDGAPQDPAGMTEGTSG